MFIMQSPLDAQIYVDEIPEERVRRRGDIVSIPIPPSRANASTRVKVTARRGNDTVAEAWAIAP